MDHITVLRNSSCPEENSFSVKKTDKRGEYRFFVAPFEITIKVY